MPNISSKSKVCPLYTDDSLYESKHSTTFRIDDFKNINNNSKIRKSAIFLKENNRLISLMNFQKEHDFLKKSAKRKENKNEAIKYITYEDTFLENEVFIPSPSSYPGDYSEDNFLLNEFNEEYNNSCYYDSLNNSFSYKTKKEDNNIYLYLAKIKESDISSINLDIKNNNDPLFIDEKEINGKNIEYLKGKNENLEINNYTHTKDKNNISNISLNLFIKKIAKDNLRIKYSLLYKSFLEQFSIFLSVDILIEKIINAFYYYKKETSTEYSELINLLNNIVSNKYNLIKNNSSVITKLKNLYEEIKNASWLKDYLKEDTLNVNYILLNEGEEFDLNFIRLSLTARKKNIIFLWENPKSDSNNLFSLDKDKNENISENSKKNYFYIFDYT